METVPVAVVVAGPNGPGDAVLEGLSPGVGAVVVAVDDGPVAAAVLEAVLEALRGAGVRQTAVYVGDLDERSSSPALREFCREQFGTEASAVVRW